MSFLNEGYNSAIAKNNINSPTISCMRCISQSMLKKVNLDKRVFFVDIETNSQAPNRANGIAGNPKRVNTDLSISL